MKAKNVESRKDYYQYVNELVDCIQQEISSNDITDKHHYVGQHINSDRLHFNGVDNNLTVLNYSDSDPHDWRHYVNDSSSYREVIQAMAYATLRRDVYNEISERNISLE